MNQNILAILFLATALFQGCGNNSFEQEFDCTNSGLSLVSSVTDADCGLENGAISIVVNGGLPPYTYFIDGNPEQAEGVFNNLQAGNYMVSVTDQNNCIISETILVAITGGFQASATTNPSGCKASGGSITVSANNGVEPYQYKLNNGNSQTSSTFNNLGAGEYEVLVTDGTGCDFSLLKKIESGISYKSSVSSIIANSCATTNCHDGSTSQTNFTVFSNVQGKASSIKSRTQSGSMPKNGSLTQAQKDAIACWVDDGAKDN